MTDTSLIKDRLDIAEIVGEYVQLKRIGSHLKACCPFHEEKTPSFIVNEDRGTYHCFGCQKGGDAIAFLMEIEGMDFREALTILAERAGVELQAYTPEQKARHSQKDRAQIAMTASVDFYQKQLWSSSGQKALAYLRDRGLSDATIKKFHLGYAPDAWQACENHLLSGGHGLVSEDLVRAGLSVQKDGGGTYDRFRHRVMFPIFDVLGRAIGYSARVMPGQDDAGAKYINTPESLLYHKSDILYGIDLAKQAIKKSDRVVLVEGNADVIAAHEGGIDHVVAVSGTALTVQHIKILKRYTQNFTLFFDGDAAGQNAAYKSAQLCLAHDVQCFLVALTSGKDAADLVQEDATQLLRVVDSARGAIDYFIDQAKAMYDIADPHGKRQATDYLLGLVANVSHPVEREEWIKKCAHALEVEDRTMHAILTKDFSSDKAVASHSSSDQPAKTSAQSQSEDVATASDRGPLDNIAREMMRLALAFPDAWKMLVENAHTWSVFAEHKTLQVLVRGGPDVSYDALAFLRKYFPGSDAQYPTISAHGEAYMRMHGGAEQAQRDIIVFAKRAQREFDKQQLAVLTKALRDAETSGDDDQRDQIMQKIIVLTQDSS